MTMKFNRIDAVFCVLSDHSDLFQNMIQNMICRILLGAPRLYGITPFGAAHRPGDGHC